MSETLTLHRGYRYALQPTTSQAQTLRDWIGVTRLVYNLCLEQRRDWPARGIAGVYALICEPTGRLYVGSAVNIRDRWARHLRELEAANHRNSLLQRAWNKYGAASFRATILERIEAPDTLLAREQIWIDQLKSAAPTGFNLAPVAGGTRGLKMSAESRARMSASAKGRVHSAQARRRLSASLTGLKRSEAARANNSAAQTEAHRKAREAVLPLVKELRASGLSLAAIADEMNRRGIARPSGFGVWTKGSANMLLARDRRSTAWLDVEGRVVGPPKRQSRRLKKREPTKPAVPGMLIGASQ